MIRAREGETWTAEQSSSCVRDGLKYRAKPQSAPCSCLCLLVFPLPKACRRPQDGSAREQEGCAPQAPLLQPPSSGCWLGWGLGFVFFSPFLTLLLSLLYRPSSVLAAAGLRATSLQAGCPEQCCMRSRCSFCHSSAEQLCFSFLSCSLQWSRRGTGQDMVCVEDAPQHRLFTGSALLEM